MESIKKRSSSEENFFNHEKTVDGIPKNSSKERIVLQTPDSFGRKSNSIIELRALILSIEYPQKTWPGEALKAVVKRFVRMPLKGWQIFKEIYLKI